MNAPLRIMITASLGAMLLGAASEGLAAVRIDGQVQAGGGPVASSTVTLWAASAGEPKQLAQAKTSADGSFALSADTTSGPGVSLYLVANGGVAAVNKSAGDNPALAFLAVLGGSAPANVTVNEMTTIASVWTNAQFLDGTAIKGPAQKSQHRGRQRAQLRRSLNGRLRGYDCGRPEQHADADARQFRHVVECAGWLRHANKG